MTKRLIEGTGLQYICISNAGLSERQQGHSEVFYKSEAYNGNLPPGKFNPYFITPDPRTSSKDQCLDVWNNPIDQDRLFRLSAGEVLAEFDHKWLPLPYTGRVRQTDVQEVDANNWVRLWYERGGTGRNSYNFVLCVDTEASAPKGNRDFSKAKGNTDYSNFPKDHLNNRFTLQPLSPSFWRSTALKGWIRKIGRNVKPAHELDAYPAYSHFLALLQMLAKFQLLPDIQLDEAMGLALHVHLFLDVGNSRTCGIVAECLPDGTLQPESFEKVRIRNPYFPNTVYSEPFDTRCAFLPSPFDSEFNPDLDWSPNFRVPSVLRIGDTVEDALGDLDSGGLLVGHSTLSSPKRYLWANDLEPTPWFFAKPDSSRNVSVIKGDLLDDICDDGYPKWMSKLLVPQQPRYPKSSLMTFFVLEVLFHALSQINSVEHRTMRSDSAHNKRILKSVVITTPNGMVRMEQLRYERRVTAAVELFWRYYGLPEEHMPKVYFGFDEATCAQLVYLYSIVRNSFGGSGKKAFQYLGRPRKALKGGKEAMTLRVASIDIGGGTSDLMITEYVDESPGPVQTLFRGRPLCQEGVSVAGDEVVRSIIRDIIMPHLIEYADENVESDALTMDHLRMLFGSSTYSSSPEFALLKKRLSEKVWIPMGWKYLAHAASSDPEDNVMLNFDDFFMAEPPSHSIVEGFQGLLRDVVHPGFHLDLSGTTWRLSRKAVAKAVHNTLSQTFRIFSEVIAQFNCDLLLLAGKLSCLPIVREMFVRFCPVPPSQIVSLTDFEAGNWYPFDKHMDRIKDAKTTVAVGAALWFFSERLNAIPRFTVKTDKDSIESSEIFIGELANGQIPTEALIFPQTVATQKFLSLSAPTYLGSRFIDCEAGHANMLYEVSIVNHQNYETPIKVFLKQDLLDKSLLTPVRASDANGKKVDLSDVRLALRTLDSDLYWLDTGAIW